MGVVLVRGFAGPAAVRETLLALGVGATIAAYTLVDSRGLRHANPLAYLEVVFAPVALALLLTRTRAVGTTAMRAAVTARACAAGLGFLGAYGLVLAALQLASVASVAAVRECSIVMLVGWLALTRSEPTPPSRLAGAVLVTAGVALVALG